MSECCKDPLTACCPGNCQNTPDPVMPRCDIPLNDGSFTNATVVVQGGCIIGVNSGELPVFEVDECCDDAGGGGGGGDCDCIDGKDGRDGVSPTISIGDVNTLSADSDPTVWATGSGSSVILNFGLPRCDCDSVGGGGCENGIVYDESGGLIIEEGCVTGYTPDWPPLLNLDFQVNAGSPQKVTFMVTKSSGTATVNADFTQLINDYQGQINALEQAIGVLESTILTLQSNVSSLQNTVNNQQSTINNMQTQISSLSTRVSNVEANCCD